MNTKLIRALLESGEYPRAFGPKTGNHPSVGEPCPACHEPFKAGEWTTLVTLGPGRDPEEQEKMREGRYYTAVAIEAHYECIFGITAEELAGKIADGRWRIEGHPYVGDSGLIWIGECRACDYVTGKNTGREAAEDKVNTHWEAKHGHE